MSSGQGTHRTDLVPSEFYLSQNHPNPFSEKTTVKFCVATRTRVTLEVLNPEGEIVGTLLDEEKEPGTYETEFDALHIAGGERDLPDGVYIYRLRAADFSASKRMILLRERTSASLPGHPFRTFHNSYERSNVMKTLSVALLLMASMMFVLVGCSDNPTLPVSPTDQSAQASTGLQKAILTNFSFTHNPIPPYFVDPGVVKLVDGMWIMKDVGVIERVVSSDPLIDGIMIHYLSGSMDATTGEGPVHGKGIVTPTADVSGGVWEIVYEGYRSKSAGIYFTLPLKVVAHGKGGTIDGMQGYYETTITAWGTPPQGWFGAGGGFYKSH